MVAKAKKEFVQSRFIADNNSTILNMRVSARRLDIATREHREAQEDKK